MKKKREFSKKKRRLIGNKYKREGLRATAAPEFWTKLIIGGMKKKREFSKKKRRLIRINKCQREGTDQLRNKMARLATPVHEGEDGISGLPDEILVSILSRLSLREAVRTSALSKRWRYVWTCISVVNFDAKENNNNLSCSNSQYSKMVSCVLAQHKGLNEIRICYDLIEAIGCGVIDKWIEFALSKRVDTIDLDFSNRYRLHRFSCCYTALHSSRVTELSSCGLVGFKSLKTLSLKAIDVGDDAIQYLISNCPLLERLFLHYNSALRDLKVVGSSKSLMLRYLEVVICERIRTIEICDASHLVSFNFVGRGHPQMLIKNTPQLVEVSLNLDTLMYHAKTTFSMFSSCFSQLQILQLATRHFAKELLSTYIWPKLENLKQFVLAVDRFFDDSLFGYLVMIKNWPNLRTFALELYSEIIYEYDGIPKAATEDMREAARYSHPCLKEVKITGFCNYDCDFEFVKQITENAVTLEKIIIDPNSQSEDYGEFQRSSFEQQLRTQVPPRVELVML